MSLKLIYVYVIVMITLNSCLSEFITTGSFIRADMPGTDNTLCKQRLFTEEEELTQTNINVGDLKKKVKGYFQPNCHAIQLNKANNAIESVNGGDEMTDLYKAALDKTFKSISKDFPDVLKGFISLCVAKFDLNKTNMIQSIGNQSNNNYSGIFALCDRIVDCENDKKHIVDDTKVQKEMVPLKEAVDAANAKRDEELAKIGGLQFEISDLEKKMKEADEDTKQTIQEQIDAKTAEIESIDPDRFDDEICEAEDKESVVFWKIKAHNEMVMFNTIDSKGKKTKIPYCLHNYQCIKNDGISGAFTSHIIMLVPNSSGKPIPTKLSDLSLAKNLATKKHVGYMVGYLGASTLDEIASSENADTFEELRGQQIYHFDIQSSKKILV
jgi:hypothetical protein